MIAYTLWTNWTTIFLVSEHGLSQKDANWHFAWIPPVFASLGGLSGGWLSLHWANRGVALYRARQTIHTDELTSLKG